MIASARPDVVLLTGFDWDHDLIALAAYATALTAKGMPYPYRFALRPNTGWMTEVDLDGDGRLRGPGDAQGYGTFAGEGGMAILSRLPIDDAAARDFSQVLWRDLPGSLVNAAGLSDEAKALQRLSTTAHWDVPVKLPDQRTLHLLAFYASPPVFDGPEDRNGRRNHDEAAFWLHYLDGALDVPTPAAPFVILGDVNLDPADGDGRRAAIARLLADPRLQDTRPSSPGGAAAAAQGGPNDEHKGDPSLDTADWPEFNAETGARGAANLRVDYVLPSSDLRVTASGVWWPAEGQPGASDAAASRHRLVWVDVALE